MRDGVVRVLVFLTCILAVRASSSAQPDENNPLTVHIRELENAVSSHSGRGDGAAWLNLAVLYQDAARYADSGRAYRKAIALLKTKDSSLYADALDRMGVLYVEQGKPSKAEPLEQKALTIRRKRSDSTAIGRSLMHLAQVAYGKHDLAAAQADAEMAAALLAPENPRRRPQAADTSATVATPEEQMTALVNLALIRCARGEFAATSHDLSRAMILARAGYPENSLPVGFLDFLLGYTNWKSGDSTPAGEQMKRGIDEMDGQLGWGHPAFVEALKQYRAFLIQSGRADEAALVASRVSRLDRTAKSGQRQCGSLLGGNSLLAGISTMR